MGSKAARHLVWHPRAWQRSPPACHLALALRTTHPQHQATNKPSSSNLNRHPASSTSATRAGPREFVLSASYFGLDSFYFPSADLVVFQSPP